MEIFRLFICSLSLTISASAAEESDLRPLVMIHGLSGSYDVLEVLSDRVHQDFPNMEAFSLDAFNDAESFESLEKQVETFGEMLLNITDEYGDITLLGFSQGGLVARAIVEMYGNPHIHTFISLSAPSKSLNFSVPFTKGFRLFCFRISEVLFDARAAFSMEVFACLFCKYHITKKRLPDVWK